VETYAPNDSVSHRITFIENTFSKTAVDRNLPWKSGFSPDSAFSLFPAFAPTIEIPYAKAVPKPIADSQVPIIPPGRGR